MYRMGLFRKRRRKKGLVYALVGGRSKRRQREPNPLLGFILLLFLIFIPWMAAVNNSGNANGLLALIIIFLVLFFALIILSIVLKTPTAKGKIGERKVSKRLNKLARKYGGYVIDDVMIPGENGKTSQIDHIYISEYGIFVIETKNYSGRIYGSENQQFWTQVLAYGNTKNQLYNPVKQNLTHIYRLIDSINIDVGFISVVVFVNGNTDYIESDHVWSLGGLKYLITKEDEKTVSENIVEEVYDKLIEYKNNPVKSSREHVKEVKQIVSDVNKNICPRCGGKLILRNSKTSGYQFYGCEHYPKCKFTKKSN